MTSKVEQRAAERGSGAEVAHLRHEVERLTRQLEDERAHRVVLQTAVGYATARVRALERSGGEPVPDSEIVVEPEDFSYQAAYDAVLTQDHGVRAVTRPDGQVADLRDGPVAVDGDMDVAADADADRFAGEAVVVLSEAPAIGQPARSGYGNVYVFDDEDESRAAFDEFFSAPDPHLEKVRGFLLD